MNEENREHPKESLGNPDQQQSFHSGNQPQHDQPPPHQHSQQQHPQQVHPGGGSAIEITKESKPSSNTKFVVNLTVNNLVHWIGWTFLVI